MNTLKRLTGILIFCLAIASINAAAQTSVFTYQGKLTDISAPANGNYDFTFKLFDAATEGTQIGTNAACNGTPTTGADAVCDNVQVNGGIFTVKLDFGATTFSNGAARFLEISVRAGASTGAYTLLTPRQQITSAPFSIKSLSAASADSLACSLCVTDGQIQSIDGSKVTGTVANATTATTAGNVSGIVAIANGGTGSATKNFVDLTTNQTIVGNKNFVQTVTASGANIVSLTVNGATVNGTATFNNGIAPVTITNELNVGGAVTAEQFSGSGEGLINVPGTLKWQNVSGLAQQAQPNNGYITTNDAQTTITLPTAPSVGDIVRVSSPGSGGWKIAQNAGQTIIGANIFAIGASWIPRESNRLWRTVASSADGNKLVAVVQNGQIYTSVDSGVSWTPRESNRNWLSVASSADGNKLVAADSGGQIYTSTDSGVTWTARESNRNWRSLASSADGNKLVAADSGGRIYTSADSGITWTPRDSNRGWLSVASSADGSKLVAAVYTGQIYTSADSGITWTPRESNRNWWSVASSADGSKLVAGVVFGQIYTSVDSGVSWTPRENNREWWSVASSADGSKLVAADSGGRIYTSADSGITWTPRENNRDWWSVASSADGSKLVAIVTSGQIYTSALNTTVGTTGYLTGGQYSAIELQYMGNGQFLPLSHSGTISGF